MVAWDLTANEDGVETVAWRTLQPAQVRRDYEEDELHADAGQLLFYAVVAGIALVVLSPYLLVRDGWLWLTARKTNLG